MQKKVLITGGSGLLAINWALSIRDKYELGIKPANCFKLNSGLINKSSFNDKIKLVDRPKDMSLSNKKICKVLECEFLSVDEQFQEFKQQENNNMTNKVIVL
jgi:hypothetical protein